MVRCMAVLLFIASILPFIGHACAMAAHGMPEVKKCCCEKAHSAHEGMEHMDEMTCKHRDSSHAGHDSVPPDDCCQAEVESLTTYAAKRVKAAPIELLDAQLIIPLSHEVITHPILTADPPPGDLRPPPMSSPPIRVLIAQFLI